MPSSRTVIMVLLLLVVSSGVIIFLFSTPASAITGGPQVTVCNLNLAISGDYNDNGISHWITGFSFSSGASGCHAQTLLDEIPPPPSYNIFPVTIYFNVVLTAQDGSVHGPYQITYSIPPLNYNYNFQASTIVASVPSGSYSVTVTSSVPLGSGSGSTTYTTTISF